MRPASLLLLGFAVGVAGTLLMLEIPILGAPTLGLIAFALIRLRSAAPYGGLCLAVGVLFAFLDWRSVEQCESFNRSGGFCEMLDPAPHALIALLFLGLGVALSAYGLLRRSPG